MFNSDETRTGGFGWPTLARVTPEDVHNVLGDRCQDDPNGMTATHYTRQLSKRDFFTTLSPQMEQQILRLIELSTGVGYLQVRNHLDGEIKSLLGVEE